MADIALLLIIFFIVTTLHEVDRTNVALPQAASGLEAQRAAAVVVMYKDASGEIAYKFTEGEAMSFNLGGVADVYLEASRLTYKDPARQFVLKADASIRFEKIDELLDQMRRGGVRNILLQTRQQPAVGP
jgi:biopolymer transport protein ExbD